GFFCFVRAAPTHVSLAAGENDVRRFAAENMALQLHPGRGAMTNANWFRRRLVLVACIVLAVLAVRVCDCVRRPIITWNRFAAALKSGNLALANSFCDRQTVKA